MKSSVRVAILVGLAVLTVGSAPAVAAPHATNAPAGPAHSFQRCPSDANARESWTSRASKLFLRPAAGRQWCFAEDGFQVNWQTDGNFVLYNQSNGRAVYASGTNGTGRYLYLSTNGNTDVLDAYKRVVWTSNAYADLASRASKTFWDEIDPLGPDVSWSYCPVDYYMTTRAEFNYDHNPPITDTLWPWVISASNGGDYTSLCDYVTTR